MKKQATATAMTSAVRMVKVYTTGGLRGIRLKPGTHCPFSWVFTGVTVETREHTPSRSRRGQRRRPLNRLSIDANASAYMPIKPSYQSLFAQIIAE